ncbi:hypothetical protein [Pseudobdellovibrio exovorus]|uniref:Polysaccharide polymerase n=1 Tax=Pseudobdellovibrio exovorus JSS TaxID=1184267 RepID=M4VR75_9BACT|nr:hypothetical protein [Pseudobdellovibrio exovorus]AGH95679.1 hypothetical protein A11Q_1463 [Pseudobdellovibrio exovorus JSS]
MNLNIQAFSFKHNFIYRLVALTMIIGFPRIYNTEIPLAALLLPFYLKEIYQFSKKNAGLVSIFVLLVLLFLLIGSLSFLIGSGEFRDISFHFQILIKIILSTLFGIILYEILRPSKGPLLTWLVIQICIIIVSGLSSSFFQFMLGFISPKSADVFQHIWGLRTVGLGLLHVDGATNIISAVFYLSLLSKQMFLTFILWFIIFPISMTLARSALIPYSLFSIFSSRMHIRIPLLFSLLCMFILSPFISSGPMFEALELFRNFISQGSFSSTSVSGTADMYKLPTQISTWIIGDGLFFINSPLSLQFYMNTDIGYLRILFFGGLPYLLLFIAINSYFLLPLIFCRKTKKTREISIFSFVLLLVFAILNTKGIQTIPVFATAIFCVFKDIKKYTP